MTVLVERRCRTCRRLLDRVVSAPAPGDEAGWAGWVYVSVCPQHGDGAGRGGVRAWQARQRRAGKPDDRVTVGAWVPWAGMREAVAVARRTGRAYVLPA